MNTLILHTQNNTNSYIYRIYPEGSGVITPFPTAPEIWVSSFDYLLIKK